MWNCAAWGYVLRRMVGCILVFDAIPTMCLTAQQSALLRVRYFLFFFFYREVRYNSVSRRMLLDLVHNRPDERGIGEFRNLASAPDFITLDSSWAN